jgi:hypothetical protein
MKVKVIIGGNVISLFDSETYEPIEIESVHFRNSNEGSNLDDISPINKLSTQDLLTIPNPDWRRMAPESNKQKSGIYWSSKWFKNPEEVNWSNLGEHLQDDPTTVYYQGQSLADGYPKDKFFDRDEAIEKQFNFTLEDKEFVIGFFSKENDPTKVVVKVGKWKYDFENS